VQRAAEVLEDAGIAPGSARVLVVGAAYKPGVEDVRESPAVEIMRELVECGADVAYHDPLVRAVRLDDRLTLLSQPRPQPADYDLAIVVTLHPGRDCAWLAAFERVLDCTYRTDRGRRRFLI
jgi:UDP-N-acetyl-D-mannosaminuronate dehydrogenase